MVADGNEASRGEHGIEFRYRIIISYTWNLYMLLTSVISIKFTRTHTSNGRLSVSKKFSFILEKVKRGGCVAPGPTLRWHLTCCHRQKPGEQTPPREDNGTVHAMGSAIGGKTKGLFISTALIVMYVMLCISI